jgi:hypothetical protein
LLAIGFNKCDVNSNVYILEHHPSILSLLQFMLMTQLPITIWPLLPTLRLKMVTLFEMSLLGDIHFLLGTQIIKNNIGG